MPAFLGFLKLLALIPFPSIFINLCLAPHILAFSPLAASLTQLHTLITAESAATFNQTTLHLD